MAKTFLTSLITYDSNSPILLFDGVCNLCNGAVDFILKHESSPKLYFASIQSAEGQKILTKFNRNSGKLDTLYVLFENKLFEKSEAIIILTNCLKWPWRLIGIIKYLPKVILNFGYDFIAKYRYKFFGKKESCRIPSVFEKRRFIG